MDQKDRGSAGGEIGADVAMSESSSLVVYSRPVCSTWRASEMRQSIVSLDQRGNCRE